ncbi:MAG: CU044_5270 family protein, partial [Streptosporangiaceae bacterium]
MNASDPRAQSAMAELAALLPVPPERDLPPGRCPALKEHLMTEIASGLAAAKPPAPPRHPRRRPAVVLITAAVTAVAAAVAGVVFLGRSDRSGGSASPAAVRLLSEIATIAARGPAADVRDGQYAYVSSEVAYTESSMIIGQPGTHSRLAKPHLLQAWTSVSDLCRPGLQREYGRDMRLAMRGVSCPYRGALNDPTYRLLQSLPTSPRALLHLIATAERGHGPSPAREEFVTIGDLLGGPAPPPEVAAALFPAADPGPKVVVVLPATNATDQPHVA